MLRRCSVVFCVAWTALAAIRAPAGGDLQQAIDSAQPGDEIILESAATFTGPFRLPRKDGDEWITIRSEALDALPQAGGRVQASHRGAMPKLVSGKGWVVASDDGAHHFRFIGIEFAPAPGVFLYNLVLLGTGEETSLEQLPHDIEFDRCFFTGDPGRGTRRGIALNGSRIIVTGSHFTDFKEAGAESQAVMGWNGPGPFQIINNRLEAAGENILFGGADPAIEGLVPSDIEIRRNYLSKPLTWKREKWVVKNLLELKSARRVRIESNVLENNWAGGQSGFAVLFTPRNQDGRGPWSVVEDVAFVNNIVRGAGGGVNIQGWDDLHPSQQTRRIEIRNNLFEDLDGRGWGGPGAWLQMIDAADQIVVEYNTALQSGAIITVEGRPHTGFRFVRNVTLHNAYGIKGSGARSGRATLEKFFPGAVVEGNVIAGAHASDYPPGNQFPSRLEPDEKASGRIGAGADMQALEAARAAVL